MTTTMTMVAEVLAGVAEAVAAMAIDTHHHQWAHIRLPRTPPKNINQPSILINHHRTPTPFRIAISIGKIYCPLPYYCHDHGMRQPTSSAKCYNQPCQPVTCYHVRSAKHHSNRVYFGSISIAIILATVPFARCYSVADGSPIRIRCEIICASSTQCNGPKWKRCAHPADHSVVQPILNDQCTVENSVQFVKRHRRGQNADKSSVFFIIFPQRFHFVALLFFV